MIILLNIRFMIGDFQDSVFNLFLIFFLISFSKVLYIMESYVRNMHSLKIYILKIKNRSMKSYPLTSKNCRINDCKKQ